MTKREWWNGTPVPYGAPVQELCERVKEPGPTAWAALEALGQDPSPAALNALVQCTASPDWRFRRAAVEAISGHQLAHSVAALLCRALQDESAYVVRTACQAVGRLEIRGAHDALVPLLAAQEAQTRGAAVRALSRLWQPGDFALVLHRFTSDPSEAVRREAAWTLHETVQTETWKQLFELWKQDKLPRHRQWACELAARYGTQSVRGDLEALTLDPDGHVRKAARKALEQAT